MSPATNRINWHECHMLQAVVASMRSPDPQTKVGACIVNPNNVIVGVGYNGVPRGINPKNIPWNREPDKNGMNKYFYIAHSEANAILNSNASTVGCSIYSTLFPCAECAKLIIQAGIRKVYYLDNKYENTPSVQASFRMFNELDIQTEHVNLSYAIIKH